MSDVEIHRTADLKKMKKPLLVIGFPGTGLVGSVAASQLVESLQLSFGGYISSANFAPLAAIHNYKPLPAARIHYSEKQNMIVVISEMTIPIGTSMELADKIFDFARSVDASSIISLGGISLKEEKGGDVYVISSDPAMTKDIEVGDVYTGRVVKTTAFGAFVEDLAAWLEAEGLRFEPGAGSGIVEHGQRVGNAQRQIAYRNADALCAEVES
jgi:predicted ATP-grasp superfamily ATP-dependent carboligase